MFDDLKRKYETDGYAVLENFYTNEEVEEMKQEAQRLIECMPSESKRVVFSTTNSKSQHHRDQYFLDSSDKISYFYEEGALNDEGELQVEPELSLNKIGHALHELNPVFRKMTFCEKVKEAAYQLGYEEPVVPQSMIIFKNPKIGGEVSAHQDATYLYTEPVRLTGYWIALDDATVENGCLWISKGSHNSGVHSRYFRNPDPNSEELLISSTGKIYYQQSSFIPIPVKKGTCIILHGQVVHRSDANRSSKPRKAYTFHIVEQKNTQYAKDNWLQPKNRPFLNLYTTF